MWQICSVERHRNPFRFGGEISARDLVDREIETAQVENTIRNGEKLFLIGPRRFGKTSILRSVTDRLEDEGAIVRPCEVIMNLNDLGGVTSQVEPSRAPTEQSREFVCAESRVIRPFWPDSHRVDLLRQSDAADEIRKPRIVTEGLESTPSYEICELRVALLVSLFHPVESHIQVTQGSIENCD